MSNLKKYIPPVLWVVAFQVISSLIGLITRSNIDSWYVGLEKSSLTPPNIAFPIVWTSLYVLIALAGWKIFFVRRQESARPALLFFVIYAVLNWGWSLVFFEFHWVCTAFFWILAVNVTNIAFIVKSWNVSRAAAFLMILPLLWAGFAAYLNYQIWMLN